MARLLFFLCLLGAAAPLVLYPAIAGLAARLRPRPWTSRTASLPSVSVIIVMRDAAAFVAQATTHFQALDYPAGKKELILYEDGLSEAFAAAAATKTHTAKDDAPRIVAASGGPSRGKARCLEQAAALARGEILVFADADSALAPQALVELTRPFADPAVGGVCGRRVIGRDSGRMRRAQGAYFDFDRTIKEAESRVGSLTSNDGKIYAVRRTAFRGVPDGVPDDLFVCLDVVRQGLRFVYAPGAVATVRTPSRSEAHELERRRRIVCRSLRGIRMCRELLDPRRSGGYAAALFVNKVLRRGLPFFLAGMFVTSAILAPGNAVFALLFLGQLGLALLALAHPSRALAGRFGLLPRLAETAWYFLVGNLGTALGVLDFARGRVIVAWTPNKGEKEE